MAFTAYFILLLYLLQSLSYTVFSVSRGYILYCPCMGRFGNQADNFLGVLGFAKGLNRTLVVPPWIEYKPGVATSTQVPFNVYFKVEPLRQYHEVMTMEDFMENLADEIWPKDKRKVLCYLPRHNSDGCNAKDGNPFGPFWDSFNIDFVGSEYYHPLNYDVYHQNMGEKWNTKFPPSEWPVLAFTGAPASFPIQKENVALHRYLDWSDALQSAASKFIATLPKAPFVGIHLRNGIDWDKACVHVEKSPNLFASPQCLGYRNEHGVATRELCMPSNITIFKQLKRVIKSVKAKSVFVASDNYYMINEITNALKNLKISVHRHAPPNPHIDLAVLGRAHHFIANCVSSFSAFAVRARRAIGFPVSFWAFPPEEQRSRKARATSVSRDEL